MTIEVPAVLGGIKTALDLVKALDPNNAVVREIWEKLLDAREALLEQKEEIDRLESELTEIRRFSEEDRARFEKSTVAGKTETVPCYKETDGDGTPYCANCFENFRRSILFRSRVENSLMLSYSCFNCGLKIDRV